MPNNKRAGTRGGGRKAAASRGARAQRRPPPRPRRAARRAPARSQRPILVKEEVPARSAIQGQTNQVNVMVTPHLPAFYSLTAAFIHYGLTLGADKTKVEQYMAALNFCWKECMADRPAPLQKAPAIWWKIANSLRPKTVVHKGVSTYYSFNIDRIEFIQDTFYQGHIIADQTTADTLDGFTILNDSIVPELTDAALAGRLVSELFGYYKAAHPLVTDTKVGIKDPSAYAFKRTMQEAYNNSDEGRSAYSEVLSEVPITSWLAYLGLASKNNTLEDDVYVERVPKYSAFTMGDACHHVGVRLMYPQYNDGKHRETRVVLLPVDIETWMIQQASVLVELSFKLDAAERETGPIGQAPEQYYNSVCFGLYWITKYYEFIGGFLPFSACWAGASNKCSAVATGTNTVDASAELGLSGQFWSVASRRELMPKYNRIEDAVTIPFPVVYEGTLATLSTMFSALFQAEIDGQKLYATPTFDLLNSRDSDGVLVAIMDGFRLRDDKQLVTNADAMYLNNIPTASLAASAPDVSHTNLPTQALVALAPTASFRTLTEKGGKGGTYERNAQVDLRLRTFEVVAKRTKGDYKKNHAAWEKLTAQMKSSREKRASKRREAKFASDDRESPDTTEFTQLGTASVVPLDIGTQVEQMLAQPLGIPYDNLYVDGLKYVAGLTQSLKGGTRAIQSLAINRIGQAGAFVGDSQSTQKSEVSTAVLDLANGALKETMPSAYNAIASVKSQAGPILGGIAKFGELIVGGFRESGRKMRARRASRRN